MCVYMCTCIHIHMYTAAPQVNMYLKLKASWTFELKSPARLHFENIQCLSIWLLTLSVLGAPVEELCALARKVHILKSQPCRHFTFYIRPRMENSHSGRPRTAECVVKCVSQQQNESNGKGQWYNTLYPLLYLNILPTFIFQFTASL